MSLIYKFLNFLNFKYTIRKSLNTKIISIGNLTTGGTGKTPMVLYLIKMLQNLNYNVGVLSRGYKGSLSKKGAVLTDGKTIFLTPSESGDEPFFIASQTKNVIIGIGRNRYKMGKVLLQKYKIDVFLLDDGFQHYSLKRNLDIVLLDATNTLNNLHLLPKGPLREPLHSIKRAHCMIITKSNLVSQEKLQELKVMLSKISTQLILVANHQPLHFLNIHNTKYNINFNTKKKWNGQPIYLISSIADPSSFEKILDINFKHHFVFKDHHRFYKKDILNILKVIPKNGIIITTEKDWIRLQTFKALFNHHTHFFILQMEIQLTLDDRKKLFNKIIVNY